ncbi:hypothetical protein ACOSQ4_007251 [Xanthoceras sorbifolium]
MDESEGVGAPIEKEAEVIKPRVTFYGPWMMVLYGRNGKSSAKGNTSGNGPLNTVDNVMNDVGKSSGPTIIGSVKARGTGVASEKFRNNKVSEKNNSLNRATVGKRSRFVVLVDSVEEESVPHVDHKSKGKSPMVMTGDDDVTLAKGLCIFRDIFNMGPSPCKEVAGIKSGSLKSLQKSPKIKKASYVKQGPKGISKGLGQDNLKALDKNLVLEDVMEDDCNDCEVLKIFHQDVIHATESGTHGLGSADAVSGSKIVEDPFNA